MKAAFNKLGEQLRSMSLVRGIVSIRIETT